MPDNEKSNNSSLNNMYKQDNAYQDFLQTYAEGFVTDIFNDGIVNDVKQEDLVKWFANPDKYHNELEKASQYFYISNGDIFQQTDLVRTLPTLNYKIEVLDKPKTYEKNIVQINKVLKKIEYRTLVRDTIVQEVTAGTLVGIWLGDKKSPYFYTFDNLEYVFPAYRKNGEWIAWFDLSWLSAMEEIERENNFDNLSPYITRSDYSKYQKNPTKYRYIELPQDRTVILRTHTSKRNQRLGIPWATQGLMDIAHKKKLKDMEAAIANKVIRSVAICKLGNDKIKEPQDEPNKDQKKKVVAGVKKALSANEKVGTPVIALPFWSDLSFSDTKTDALDPKKFETINSDINSSLGTGGTMKDGTGGNFASGKINYEVFYMKIGALLEEIEDQMFGKLLCLILPAAYADDYQITFDKEPPLTKSEKLDSLSKLQGQGFSTKAIIDCIDGVTWDKYISQSLYEIEMLKLREKILPPQSYSTISKGDSENGRPESSDDDNDSTIKSKTNDGNNLPDTE